MLLFSKDMYICVSLLAALCNCRLNIAENAYGCNSHSPQRRQASEQQANIYVGAQTHTAEIQIFVS